MGKNFKYLDDLIHSDIDEIVLDTDIILEKGEEFFYSKGITLDIDDIVIDGCGHIIDADKKARIFNCTGKKITIRNVTLKNGHSTED